MDQVVAVVGPTASGKTELAVALARALGGEVISADSRQVYRRLDAGTAKPSRDAQGLVEGIAYHLVDVADPAETFDAGRFARLAGEVLAQIKGRGRVPIVAGGTGLYVRALLEGLSEMPPSDPKIRERLTAAAKEEGRSALHERLSKIDPAAAAAIPANNIQRVLRALEVYELTGKPISSFWTRDKKSSANAVFFLIDWPNDELKARVKLRAERMWPDMLEETKRLLAAGFSGAEPGFQSLGYREAISVSKGELSRDEGLALLIRSTNQYAKRQRTWFKNQTPGARVIPGGPLDAMVAKALEALHVTPALAR